MSSRIVVKQSTISALMFGIFFLISVLLGCSILYMSSSLKAEQSAEKRRTEFKQLGINLADASDYLTDEARKYAVTKEISHLEKYWEEINQTKTRDNVISKLQELDSPAEERALLAEAKKNSDALVNTERHSMRLVLEAQGVPESEMIYQVATFQLDNKDKGLSPEEKFAKARDLMFNAQYDADKKSIMDPIAEFQKIMNSRLERELENARNGTTRAAVLQILLAVIIICAIAALLRILIRHVTYPIKNYTELLKVFSFDNESFSLLPEGSQELRLLAATFNELYITFQNELVKRRQAETIMKAAKEDAEKANNAKSEFLAQMSHEIRTPLNTIIGYEYLLETTQLRPKQKEYTERIGMAAKNLLGIISEILDFSKIEARRMILETVDFDLHAVISELCGMVGIEAQQKGLLLTYEIRPEVPRYVKGDSTRLKQVILNLLSNGVKFTHAGSVHILVDLLKQEDDRILLRFSVSDTGIGITEEQKEHLFEVFSQGDASTTRKYGGTGLGLAISKRIIELMGGEISVNSTMGAGSTFIFTSRLEISNGIMIKNNKNKIENCAGIFNKKKVLLVEDNKINLQMTREILENLGFMADTADSGALAVKLTRRNTYDVILLDIRMPIMDGYETAQQIRTNKDCDNIPIIALSADAVEGVSEKVKAAGMDGYLTKPLDPAKLIEVLKGFIPAEENQDDVHEFIMKEDSNAGCIDLIEGIRRIGGKKEKYMDILQQFIKNHGKDAEKLDELLTCGELEEAKRLVHTIKGIAGNIGAADLKESSAMLEKAIGNFSENDISKEKDEFKSDLKNAVGFISRLKPEEQENGSTSCGTHLEDEMKETIQVLTESLISGDPDAKNIFKTYRLLLEESMDQNDFKSLETKISNYDFEDAARDLGSIFELSLEE